MSHIEILKSQRLKVGAIACFVAIAVLGTGFAEPASTKYADVKIVFEKAGPAVEKAAKSMETASTAKGVAAAIKEFTAAMVELITKMNEYVKIYPELTNGSQAPKELQEPSDRFNAAQGRYQSASEDKLKSYGNDPAVTKAMNDMQKAFASASQ